MNDVACVIVRRNQVTTTILAALMVHGRRGKMATVPDFDWLAGMLSYVEQVARQHYRDEDTWILKPLEKAMPESRARVARMRRDHIGAGGYCVRMVEALTNWRRGWDKAIDHYLDNARDHYRLSARHGLIMRRELLPMAERFLVAAQWEAAAKGLARSADPCASAVGRDELEKALCRRMGRANPPVTNPRIDADQGAGAGKESSVAPRL